MILKPDSRSQSGRLWDWRHRIGRASLLASAIAALTLAIGSTSAHADSSIEGVWSFNGGKVAIQAQPGGEVLAGVVVAPTKFAQCTHPAGERMWSEMRPRPDGSFWGLHQWFFATDECVANPALGPTAWRVLQTPDGERFLRACFSEPGSQLQPTIAPNGSATGATFGCADSALVAALPTLSPAQLSRYVALPGNKKCLGRSKLRIHTHDPKNDPLRKVVVTVRSGTIQRRAKPIRKGKTVTAILNLAGLPAGAFTVTVRLTTVLGEHLTKKRTYTRCAKGQGRGSKAQGNRRTLAIV